MQVSRPTFFNMICALNQRQRKAHEIAPDRGVAEEILKAYHCVPSMYRPRTAPKPEKPKPVIKPVQQRSISLQAMKEQLLAHALKVHRERKQAVVRNQLEADGLI